MPPTECTTMGSRRCQTSAPLPPAPPGGRPGYWPRTPCRRRWRRRRSSRPAPPAHTGSTGRACREYSPGPCAIQSRAAAGSSRSPAPPPSAAPPAPGNRICPRCWCSTGGTRPDNPGQNPPRRQRVGRSVPRSSRRHPPTAAACRSYRRSSSPRASGPWGP